MSDFSGFNTWTPGTLVGANPEKNISFIKDNVELLRFNADGSVWVNPAMKADETARKVIDLMRDLWPPIADSGAESIRADAAKWRTAEAARSWQPIDTAPEDKPFLALRWVRDFINGGGQWVFQGVFKREKAPEHDREVFAVSLDRRYWLREATWGDGSRELDAWRWLELPAMPAPLPTKPVTTEAP